MGSDLGAERRLKSANTHSITLHGHSLSYVDSGRGPAILFIHGLLGSSRHWAHLVEALTDRHRVLIPDMFGHGASEKPVGDYSLGAHAATLRDLLDQLGVEKVTLVGHSLGGGIAIQFCYLFPERVEGLVLVASGGFGRAVNPLLRAATLPGAELMLPVLASRRLSSKAESVGRAFGKLGVKAGSDLSEVWEGFISLSDADSRRAFLCTTRSVMDPGGQTVTAHDHLPQMTGIPTLIVWGSRDRMIPCSHGKVAQQAIPGSRLEVFDKIGHFPHLDAPERFAEVLSEFMEDALNGRPVNHRDVTRAANNVTALRRAARGH